MPIVVGAEGVVGRLQIGTIFVVVGGTQGVVGALIVVVVGLGSWLGGPGGSPGSDANEKNSGLILAKDSLTNLDEILPTILLKLIVMHFMLINSLRILYIYIIYILYYIIRMFLYFYTYIFSYNTSFSLDKYLFLKVYIN